MKIVFQRQLPHKQKTPPRKSPNEVKSEAEEKEQRKEIE